MNSSINNDTGFTGCGVHSFLSRLYYTHISTRSPYTRLLPAGNHTFNLTCTHFLLHYSTTISMVTFTGTHPPQKNTVFFMEKRFCLGHISYSPYHRTLGNCRDSNEQQGVKGRWWLCQHCCQMCLSIYNLSTHHIIKERESGPELFILIPLRIHRYWMWTKTVLLLMAVRISHFTRHQQFPSV